MTTFATMAYIIAVNVSTVLEMAPEYYNQWHGFNICSYRPPFCPNREALVTVPRMLHEAATMFPNTPCVLFVSDIKLQCMKRTSWDSAD